MKKRLIILVFIVLLFYLMCSCEQQGGNKGDQSKAEPAAAPSGVYWATYSNIPGPPESYKELSVTGSFYINRIGISEESIGEELAMVHFAKDSTFASGTNPNDTSEYWIEIIKNEKGKPVKIKLSSNAANDFVISVYLNETENDMPGYSSYLKSDDGVHSPDGSVISDPYADSELPIAGAKELNLKGSYEDGDEFKNTLEEAGYTTYSMRYTNKTYTVSVRKELDGRAKVEKDVLKPKGYNIDKGKTRKNIGYYSKAGDFTGSINIDWTFSNIPFTIKLDDVRLEKIEDGGDEISYTMTGTAEIMQKSFELGNVVYRLNDKQKKPFREEYGFILVKEPNPTARWDYVECWEYIDDTYGTSFLLSVSYTTGNSPTDISGVPVKELDELDGTDTMTFMMPAYGGKATWSFKKK